MASYRYEYQDGSLVNWKMQIVVGRIYAAFDKDPVTFPEFSGVNGGENFILVMFSRELDTLEKTTLDSVMSTPELGIPPATPGYTKTEIPDFTRKWKEIETDAGLNIDFAFRNEETGNIELWTYGDLTTAKRNALKTKLMNLITITKY